MSEFLPGDDDNINSLLKFSIEIDKMTRISRRTMLINKSRRENDAEHSWHIAVMSLLFKKYAPEGVDIDKACKMCIVHDLVEIYAGDTFAYDEKANCNKKERENFAANKLFGMIDNDIGNYLRELWEEFDAMESLSAKYAACMDRIQPILHNTLTDGHTWVEGQVSKSQVMKRIMIVKEVIPSLWSWVLNNIENGIQKGWIIED